MSLFGNIKDSLNLDDQGDFDGQYYYNNDQFGSEGSHQSAFGGFGSNAYGGGHSGLGQIQQQRSTLPVGLNQQQQQQAGLFRSGNVHPSMPGSENAHYLSAGNASASVQRPIGFNQNATSSLLGGAMGLGGLHQSRSIGNDLSNTRGIAGNVDPISRFGAAPPSINSTNITPMRPGEDDFQNLTENEDFPALPTSSKVDVSGSLGLMGGSVVGKDFGGSPLGAVGSAVEKGRASSIGSGHNDSSSVLGATPQQASGGSSGLLANLNAAVASAPNPASMSKEMKYGLAGLLEVIRGTDKDGYALALGTDLTTFGLNLNATEVLFPTFTSPFQESGTDEVQYKIPASYQMNATTIKLDHFGKFQIETLFYMFYQMPKDIFQALAAQELYKRDWRYHGELKVWLKPRTQQELLQGHPTVQFLYFDIKSFETRLFNAQIRGGNLLAGIIPEEEIRVRGPGGGPIGESS